jgi:hypothetical protein
LCSVAHTQTTFIGTARHSHTRRSCPELLSVCKIPYSYFYLTNYTPAEHSSAISHFQICRGMLGRRVLLIDDDSCSTGDSPRTVFQDSIPRPSFSNILYRLCHACTFSLLATFFTHHLQACMLCRLVLLPFFRGAQNSLLAFLLYRQYERLVGYVVRSLQ